jgi:hypothetical protein
MDVVEKLEALLRPDGTYGGVSRVYLSAEDVRELLSEITRLRQDLSTAIERAAKWHDVEAAKQAQLALYWGAKHCAAECRNCEAKASEHRSYASSIRSLKTESSNEQ